jgi:hypothetical protein
MNSDKVIDVEATETSTKADPKLGEALSNLGGLIWSLTVFLLMYPFRRVREVFKSKTTAGRVLRIATIWVAVVVATGVFSAGNRGEGVRYNSAVALAAVIEGEYSQAGQYAWKTVTLSPKPGLMTRAANALF